MILSKEEEEELQLEDDVLLDFDYYFNNYSASTSSPEKDLAKGVLIYGIIDYLSANRKEHYRDARKWFFNEIDDDYIFSFYSVCDYMQIEPGQFRKRLKELKKSKVKFALDGKRISS